MPAEVPLPQQLQKRDPERLRQYTDALAFYSGNQWPGAVPPRTNRRLTLNYVRTIIHKTATYVMQGAAINAIPLSDSPEHAQAATEVEEHLRQAARNNGLARLDRVTEIDAAVLGDAAYKVTWDRDEERVAVTAPDMRGIFPWPHATDPTRFSRVAHRYTLPATEVRRLWTFQPTKDPAQIIEDWTDAKFNVWIEGGGTAPVVVETNPYGLIPFVIYPNEQVPKRWWGDSDVLPLKEIAQEFNRQITRISNILELSGFPIAVLENVDEATGIAAVPGAVWELPERAKAYLLDLLQGGGVDFHLKYTDHILRTLHDLSETPRTAFGGTDRDLSGVALQVEMQPLLQKVERKRIIRSDAYSLRAHLMLRIHDIFAGTTLNDSIAALTTHWAGIVPIDKNFEGGREVALVGAAISSRRQAMARLGEQDPDAEWERTKQEAQELAALAAAAAAPAAGATPSSPPSRP